MTTHLKFRIGEKWICIEGGNGYAPDHPNHVTFAVRDVKANGKPGGRVAANFFVRRRTVLDRLLADGPLNFARHAYASAERLRARISVHRAAQRVLEHCDDERAAGLHVLIAAADQADGFFARPIVGFNAVELQVNSDASTH